MIYMVLPSLDLPTIPALMHALQNSLLHSFYSFYTFPVHFPSLARLSGLWSRLRSCLWHHRRCEGRGPSRGRGDRHRLDVVERYEASSEKCQVWPGVTRCGQFQFQPKELVMLGVFMCFLCCHNDWWIDGWWMMHILMDQSVTAGSPVGLLQGSVRLSIFGVKNAPFRIPGIPKL